jgi:DNA-binding NarL/FixJ family response regulator
LQEARKIRVLLVDDAFEIAVAYRAILNGEGDMVCVGLLPDAARLPEAVDRERPDVVLLDLGMPGPDPVGVLRALAPAHPETRFLAFTGHDDPGTRGAVIEAGAWGLVSKHREPRAVLEAVRAVHRGEVGFDEGGASGWA